jgi:hypothetical protein
MRVRPVHVSRLNKSRNALSYRHLSFHMICLLYSLFLLVDEKVKLHRLRFTRVSVSETEDGEVLNASLFMTRTRSRESGHDVPGSVVPLGRSHP